MQSLARLPRIAPGDTVGVAALSGPPHPDALAAGVRALEGLGYRVRLASNVLASEPLLGLAGTAQERAAGYRALLVDPEVNAIRLARHKRYTEQVAETIRQLQRKKLADPTLDPLITAAALGALTYRFAEMWLVHGAIDCTLEHAIEQVSQIFSNALRLKEA